MMVPFRCLKLNELGCLRTSKSVFTVRKPKDVYRLMDSPVMEGMKAKAPAVNISYPSLMLSHEGHLILVVHIGGAYFVTL